MPSTKKVVNVFTLSFSAGAGGGGDPYTDPFYGGGGRTYTGRGETLAEAKSSLRSQLEAKLSKNSDKSIHELLAQFDKS